MHSFCYMLKSTEKFAWGSLKLNIVPKLNHVKL